MPSPIATVYVVDDDSSFLTAVSRLLRAGGYTVQTFTTVADLLKRLTPDTAGCVVTDLRMPGQSGLNLQALLVAQNSPLPLIFLSGHGDIPTSVRAMRHGAVDFLSKPVKKQILFEAIERAFSLEAEQRLTRTHARALHARFDTLSAREREV